jgi:uncharacterized repeat protein (TIGR04076 family)
MTCPWKGNRGIDGCPILWHTLYPYFLGFVFGSDYGNKNGDCNVGCPADKGIDLIVKTRPYDKRMKGIVPKKWRDVIHAEVVKVNGPCDYGYKTGDRFYFPTYAKDSYSCPAGIYSLFPFIDQPELKCINLKRLRCPDWKENIYYELD